MTTDKDKIVDRIRKLLALSSNNSSQAEAEAALEKANEMMQEHQIAMSQVLLDQATTGKVEFSESYSVSETYRSFVYTMATAAGIMFDCQVVSVQDKQATFKFVGLPDDSNKAAILFGYLFASWKSINELDTRDWKREYEISNSNQYEIKKYKMGHGQGFSLAVWRRAKELVEARKSAVSGSSATGTALIICKDQIVQAFIKEKCGDGKTRGFKRQASGFSDGKQRGNAIPLTGAINNERQSRISK